MLHPLTGDNRSLSIGSVAVESVNAVRDLGVLLDSRVDHETAHQPRRQHRLLPLSSAEATPSPHKSVMKQLVCSLILSRIDYCNSILIGLPASFPAPLQRLQNAAAGLVMGLCARDGVTSA